MTLREEIEALQKYAVDWYRHVNTKERTAGYEEALRYVLRSVLPKHEAEVNTLRQKLADAESDCVRLINEKMDLLDKYVYGKKDEADSI